MIDWLLKGINCCECRKYVQIFTYSTNSRNYNQKGSNAYLNKCTYNIQGPI